MAKLQSFMSTLVAACHPNQSMKTKAFDDDEKQHANASDDVAEVVTWHEMFHPEHPSVRSPDTWGEVWAEATLVTTAPTEDKKHDAISDLSLSSPPVPDFDRAALSDAKTPTAGIPSGFLDAVLATSLTLVAVPFTMGLEMTAASLFYVARLFYKGAVYCKNRGPLFLLFHAIFQLVYAILITIDMILLSVSIFVTELLAGIGLALTTCVAGPRAGKAWHQYIRKVCHLVRRQFRADWEEPVRSITCYRYEDVDEKRGQVHSDLTPAGQEVIAV